MGDSGVGLPSSGRSSRGLDEFESPVNSPVAEDIATQAAAITVTVEQHLDAIEEANPSLEVPANNLSRTETNSISESRDVVLDSESYDTNLPNQLKVGELKQNSDSGLFGENFSLHNSQTNSLAQSSDFKSLDSSEKYNDREESYNQMQSYFDNTNSSCDLPPFRPNPSSDGGEKIYSFSEDSHGLLGNNLIESDLEMLAQRNIHPSLQSSTVSSASPFPSLASELEHVQHQRTVGSAQVSSATREPQARTESQSAPVRVIESLDKVIESLEKIMEPLEVITESDLQFNTAVRSQSDKEKLLHSYEDLSLLAQQLLETGVQVDVGSPDHFLSLTVNERCELQSRLVRLALSSYQAQLALDTSHYDLKCCLSAEVTRLSDLLDTASDPDKLCTLVRQMTELLKHQSELSRELAAWPSQSAEPGCHQLCEVVLRRLRALELLVHRNTRALSDLRNQVTH